MRYDAVVVGTGIIGSFTALALHRRGLRVLVIERSGLAPGTSRSSDGNLLCSDKPAGPLLEMADTSLRLWREFTEAYGNDCEFDPKGSTVVACGDDTAANLERFVHEHRDAGIRCEFLSSGWNTFEPALGPRVQAAARWPGDAQVQPMLACYQIARLLRREGVEHRWYTEVAGFDEHADHVDVKLASGERVSAGYLCLCTGVWTSHLLEPAGLSVPVRPRKGHICVLERSGVAVNSKIADYAYNETVDFPSDRVGDVQTAAVIEATRSGTILCGSSREFAGFDKAVDTAVMRRILADCVAIVPALAELRVLRGYTGLRPYSPDGLPLIGPVSPQERILIATGHEGAGHGLAPISAELVANRVCGEDPIVPFTDLLHPARFN